MTNRPSVLGYYADWESGISPQQIDYRLFTHITHAFATVSDDGTFNAPALAKSRDLCGRAHSAGVKAILALGGAGSGANLGRATATPDGVKRLVDQAAARIEAAGYDGIDVDWESPADAAGRDRVTALVRAIRARLPKAILTMAVPAGDWSGRWFDSASLVPCIDLLNVMTYDFHGPWANHAGHNAPLFYSAQDGHPECRMNTVDAGMTYWLKQKSWPREKLLLGVPLYGRGFRASQWGGAATGAYSRSELSYRDIARLLRDGWQRSWDATAQVPTIQSPRQTQTTELISYDDADSVQRKARYAREQGLAGIFFWEISQDFDGTTNPLVRAARAGLG